MRHIFRGNVMSRIIYNDAPVETKSKALNIHIKTNDIIIGIRSSDDLNIRGLLLC